MQGNSKLAALLADVRGCRRCVEAPCGKPLPHEPRPVLRVSQTARIVIAGQAPGTRVHASGVPFTDPSGDRLREWMGVTLREFYDDRRIGIVPMGFCFPGLDAKGGDLAPRAECAPAWRGRVFEALPQVELILAVGQYAHRWHVGGSRLSVTETVRASCDRPEDQSARPRVFALPHPSWRNSGWLKANGWFADQFLPRVQAEVRALLERD